MATEKTKRGAIDDVKDAVTDLDTQLDDKYNKYVTDVKKMGGKEIASPEQYRQIQHVLAHERMMSKQKSAQQKQQQPQSPQQPQMPAYTANADAEYRQIAGKPQR